MILTLPVSGHQARLVCYACTREVILGTGLLLCVFVCWGGGGVGKAGMAFGWSIEL
jgi:hypothetical protein